MTTLTGIWIDHAHAIVLKANKMGEVNMDSFHSEVEPHHKGGHDDSEHQTIVNQNRHDDRRHNQMKAFGKEVLKHLEGSDEIVIFGPGTAKHEFKAVLETNKALFPKLKGVETTDVLSEAELKEFMKDFFKLPRN
jgi:stalled ribosome rescue protein Dom34